MTSPPLVQVRFAALDETDPTSPESRVVHRFAITSVDGDGAPWTPGPCGSVSTTLDHGVSIEVDPMRPAGLLAATVDVPGEAIATIGRHFENVDDEVQLDDRTGGSELSAATATLLLDLFGPAIVAALALDAPLRNVGDAVAAETDTRRWDLARQLALCEDRATRLGAPTVTTPSAWAADSARLAERLSMALTEWAASRADQAARALAILPPAGAVAALAPAWPAFSELIAVIRALAGRAALDDLAELFDHASPEVPDWDDAFADLVRRAEAESGPPLRGGLAFRGAPGETTSQRTLEADDRRGLLGAERAVEVPSLLVGAVSDLIDARSVLAEWHEGVGVEVHVTLSRAGNAVMSELGGQELIAEELAVVCAEASTGQVVANRGFRVEGRSLSAVLPVPRIPDPGTQYEIRIYRRGLDDRRPRRERELATAAAASRDALHATHEAFSRAQPKPEPSRRAASELWSAAASLWTQLDQPLFAERCQRLAISCRDLATSGDDPGELLSTDLELASPLVGDEVAPGLRVVLEDYADRLRSALEVVDRDGAGEPEVLDEAQTYVHLARTLGLVEASTEIAVEAAEATSRLGRRVDKDALAEVVWRSLVLTRRDDLVRDAARLLVVGEEAAEED